MTTKGNKRVGMNNNFDFLRFVFAILVVVSHSFALSGDNQRSEWILQITNGQISYSSIGLNGFFVISGFFIFQSLQRSSSLSNYLIKRFLRLFPGLFVLLLLTIVLVSFVYSGDVSFFRNREIYTYLPNNLTLYGFQSSIKGVFDTNRYHSINGSLWTLRYEFSLYMALALLYFLRKKKSLVKILLLIAFTIVFLVYNLLHDRFAGSSVLGMQGTHILNFSAFFIFGSLLASLSFEKIIAKGEYTALFLAVIMILILMISIYFNYFNNIKHIGFTMLILLIGFMPIPMLSDFRKIGDMSYGIYIYAFPIQQTLMYFFEFNTYQLMASSLLGSIICGYFSWHIIEKHALKYKNRINFKRDRIDRVLVR